MYVPDMFRLEDRQRIARLVASYDFAQLVTQSTGRLEATHLPLMVDWERGERGTVLGHMARANPQWRALEQMARNGEEALATFQGPHAYVSPRWYGAERENVPTWNYMAVHIQGTPALIGDVAEVRRLLARLTEKHEGGAPEAWRVDRLSDAFVNAMIRGVVAFRLEITRIEAKAKLNQNKQMDEVAGVISALGEGDAEARVLAEEMKALVLGPERPDS